MKTKEIEWLDIQKDQNVLGRWIIANNLDSENLQVIGIRYDPTLNPPQLYDRMADWLKKQTPSFIEKTVLGTGIIVTFEDIVDAYYPDETYTAAEFLFRPYGELPSTCYVSEHFQEFQDFCRSNRLTEPPLAAAVYGQIESTLKGKPMMRLSLPYNATEGFSNLDDVYQFYINYSDLEPQTREKEMAHPTPLPQPTEANKTQVIHLKNGMNDHASGMLIDYHFLKDWATRHGSTQPKDWAMNILGDQVTEKFIATHMKEWKEFLSQHRLNDVEPTLRSTSYKSYVSHFEGTPLVCETAMELHQLLVQQPQAIQTVRPNDPLLFQAETWCPIEDFSAEAWDQLKPHIPNILWENATFQVDALLHDPTVLTQIGEHLHPDNLVLLTAENYRMLPIAMKTLPQLAPLALQCVLKDPNYIQKLPPVVVTPEMVRVAASRSLSAIVNLPAWQLEEAQFTDAELTYLIGHQAFDAQQAETLIRNLSQSYPSKEVEKALARLAEKHHLTYKPVKEVTQQPKQQRRR